MTNPREIQSKGPLSPPLHRHVDGIGQAGERPLDSVRALVEDFLGRPYSKLHFLGHEDVYGYYVEDHREDQNRFLRTLEAHNRQFKGKSDLITYNADVVGFIEKYDLPTNTQIFVRADLHSDLASLLAQLKMLQENHYLDEDYKCAPNFHMIFLGDYVDRGGNDLEVLTLLLKLRLENENSVHLIRGNHEDVVVNLDCSFDPNFVLEHKSELTKCYESLPLAICVGSKEKHSRHWGGEQRQYTHFSHGLFSLAVNLSPFLEDRERNIFLIKKEQTFPEELVSMSEKAKRAMDVLKQNFENEELATSPSAYQMNDIEPSYFGPTEHQYGLNPKVIHCYLRATASQGAKISALFRGHQHEFQEFAVARKKHASNNLDKIIATTLAISAAGEVAGNSVCAQWLRNQPIQGVVLTVRPKVSEWGKQAVIAETGPCDYQPHVPKFDLAHEVTTMYERLVPHP